MPRRKHTVASAHWDLFSDMIAACFPAIIGAVLRIAISLLASAISADFTRFDLPIFVLFGGTSVIMIIRAAWSFQRQAEESGE